MVAYEAVTVAVPWLGTMPLSLVTRLLSCALEALLCAIYLLVSVATGRHAAGTSQRLTVSLVGANFARATVGLLNAPEFMRTSLPCTVLAAADQYTTWTVILWSLAVTWYLYQCIMSQRLVRVSEALVHTFCWLVPAIPTGLPFITNAYGLSFDWCWIRQEGDGDWYELGTFFVPLWCIILIVFAIYIRVMRRVYVFKLHIRQAGVETPPNLMLYVLRKLGPFPVIFFVVWVFPTARRIVALFMDTPEWLDVAHAVSSPLQGTLNVMLLSRRPLGMLCSTLCCAKRKHGRKESQEPSVEAANVAIGGGQVVAMSPGKRPNRSTASPPADVERIALRGVTDTPRRRESDVAQDWA